MNNKWNVKSHRLITWRFFNSSLWPKPAYHTSEQSTITIKMLKELMPITNFLSTSDLKSPKRRQIEQLKNIF